MPDANADPSQEGDDELQKLLRDVEAKPLPGQWAALVARLRAARRLDDARRAAVHWTRVAPFSGRAWATLGEILDEVSAREPAENAFRNAMSCAPRSVGVLAATANHFLRAANYPETLRLLDRARAMAPREPKLIGAYAIALERAGHRQRALTFVDEHRGRTLDPNFAVAAARAWSRQGRHEEAVDIVTRSLAQEPLTPGHQAFLAHQLGASLEARGDHDGAFAAHTQGNAALGFRWSRQTYEAFCQAVMPYFTTFEGGRSRREGPAPIFIVGMPRSGSTLLETVLTMLPGVETVGEAPYVHETLQRIAHRAGRSGLRPYARRMSDEAWTQIADATAARYARAHPDASHVVDKMLFNFDRLDLLARLFPGARVLAMSRNPYDCCLSSYFQNFDTRMTFTRRLSDLGHVYAKHRQFLDAAESLPLQVREVRYEDLVDDLEGTMRGVTAFLGLTFDPACLQFHRNPRQARTASYDQVRRPLYRSSLGRWRSYARHLGPLFAELPPQVWDPQAEHEGLVLA